MTCDPEKTAGGGQGPTSSLSVQISTLVAVRSVVNTMIRMVYPFLGHFSRGLGVDLWQLSLAMTLRSASGIAVPFLASVADLRGRKAGMLLGLSLFIAGVGLMAFWPSYPVFVITLILTMVGNLTFVPSMQAYMGDRVAYKRRGLALALTEFSWSLSFIIGVPAMGYLIGRFGWQSPFPVLTALGVLSILALSIILPRDPLSCGPKTNLFKNMKTALTYFPALAGIAAGMAMSASNELVNLIFGVWIEDSFGVKIATLAIASAVIGASEFGGETLVSGLVDRMGKRRAVTLGLALNALAALILPVLGHSLAGALVGLFFLYLTFEFTIVSSIPLMTEVLPSLRATLMALWIAGLSTGRALGALLATHLYTRPKTITSAPDILLICLAAAVLNLAALVFLRFVRESSAEVD
jgi:DHA1 family inner membrane transport protein